MLSFLDVVLLRDWSHVAHLCSLSPLYHWAALHLVGIHTLSILIIRVVTHVNGLPETVFSLLLIRVVPGSNFLVAFGRVITSPLMPIATNATDSNRGVKLFFVSCLHKTASPTSSPSQLYVFIYLLFSSFSHTAQLGHSYRPYCHSGAKVTLYASF